MNCDKNVLICALLRCHTIPLRPCDVLHILTRNRMYRNYVSVRVCRVGTAVASMVNSPYGGIAKGAKVYDVRVLGNGVFQ